MKFVYPFKGKMPDIDPSVFIAPNAAVIGDVRIGAGSSVWYAATVRGDVNDIRIGARTNIQDASVIHVTTDYQGTVIGDDVTVGHGCILHACTIGNTVLVGMQSCVMDGVRIDDLAMIAAGSLVTPGKVIPSGQLWGGRPARFMRALNDRDIAYISWSAPHYAELALAHAQAILPRGG